MRHRVAKWVADHGTTFAHLTAGILLAYGVTLEVFYHYEAFWTLKWIAACIVIVLLALWLWRTAARRRARDQQASSLTDEAWARCVGEARSTLELAKDKAWKDMWVARKLFAEIDAVRKKLTQALSFRPTRRVAVGLTDKLGRVNPVHALLTRLLEAECIRFDEHLRDHIKAHCSADLLTEFDRTRRVKAQDNAVGEIFQSMKSLYQELQELCEEAVKTKLEGEEARRMMDKIHKVVWQCWWENAGHKHAYDAGLGLTENYRYETFGRYTSDDGNNWVSGIDLEMKSLFLKVIEPLVQGIR